jgi:very-short-patch-repair endonuclease
VLSVLERRPLESRLEIKLARLLGRSSLQPSEAQYRIGGYRVDRAWPECRVAVEADGFQHHGKRLGWKRDRRRIAAIEAMHWRIVHVTWEDVTRAPSRTLDRIASALGILAK